MRAVSIYPGYLLVYPQHEIKRLLTAHASNEPLTDALLTPGWPPRSYVLCLLTSEDHLIHAVALMHRGARLSTTTDTYRVYIDALVVLEPIGVDELTTVRARAIFLRHSQPPLNRVEPQEWQRLLKAVKLLRPHADAAIHALEERVGLPVERERTAPERTSDAWQVVAHEQDALQTILTLAGMPDARMPTYAANKPTHVLQQIALPLSEQAMLIHDVAQGLPGWELESINQKRLHVACFRDQQRALTVVNVNTSSLENTLGVDMIYYRRDLGTYIVVQYKRMRVAGGREVYYPHGSYADEYRRMARLSKYAQRSKPSVLDEYRFNPSWYYFKFCSDTSFDPGSRQLLSGYYVPLDFWQLYVQSDAARGERGGVRFTSAMPHLSTEAFSALVTAGWIGSAGAHSAAIGALLRRSISPRHKRSVLLAIVDAADDGQQRMAI